MQQFVVTVPAHEVELASDVLWGMGVVAVEERVVDAAIELWTSLGDGADVAPDGSFPWPWRFVEVDAAVADTWRQFARPIEISPTLAVRPLWVPYERSGTVLHIEPGATFGMGDHPTTILCLRAVERLTTPGATVLDVGCGSGVLAIGAMVLGASSAVGVDIAPAAVPVTSANAAANGVHVEVSTTLLEDVVGEFDLVLANILAPALVALAPHLRRVTRSTLVISGILADAHDHVLAALAPMRVVRTDTLDGWAAVTLIHP
jgi:ribosomal protein L11 methyltransferase